jgi:hypothetical protein
MDNTYPHYKSKKVQKYFEDNKDNTLISVFLYPYHLRVYGNGKGCMEHSQTRSVYLKISYIICRFKRIRYLPISEQKDSFLI